MRKNCEVDRLRSILIHFRYGEQKKAGPIPFPNIALRTELNGRPAQNRMY